MTRGKTTTESNERARGWVSFVGSGPGDPDLMTLRAVELLGDPQLRDEVGTAGHEHVKENFLTTRHIRDYLLLMLAMEHDDTDLSLLTGGTP